MRRALHPSLGLSAFLIVALMLTLSPLISKTESSEAELRLAPAATERPTEVPPTVAPSPTGTNVAPTSPDTDDGDKFAPQSAIEGIVTDLSTGLPGAGMKVQIADVIVVTDAQGHYSLTGLGAWIMPVQLLPAEGEGIPSQKTITVELDGVHTVVVDLGFYSTPPTAAPPPPQTLPETGGAINALR